MISKIKIFISVICLTVFAAGCGGVGSSSSKIIKNDKLYPFLLSGIYTVNGYGGADKFFGMFTKGINAKPGERAFLSELEEGYEQLFVFPYKGDRSGARRELSRSWGIDNKEDFLETADDLLAEGHQKAYEFCRKILDENGGEQADVNNIDINKYASEYEGRFGKIKNIQFVKDNYNKFSPAGIKAWDISRYVNNINLAFCAEFITEEEGYQLVANALIEAKKYYQDWSTYWNDFNLGRYFWGGDDDPAFTKTADSLTDKENNYSVYNYMPLN